MPEKLELNPVGQPLCQWNIPHTMYSGSNTDGSFTTAVSTSFLSPWKKAHSCRFGIIKGVFLIHIENGILCVLIRIASMRRF